MAVDGELVLGSANSTTGVDPWGVSRGVSREAMGVNGEDAANAVRVEEMRGLNWRSDASER